MGKKCKESEIFPPDKKADIQAHQHTKIPLSPHELGSNKNGYKKIKGCVGLPVVKLINPSDAKSWGRKIPSPHVTIRMKTLGGCIKHQVNSQKSVRYES